MIVERMTTALATLEAKWQGRRVPKAFYLAAEDWAAFMATDPPTGRFPLGNNPTVWSDEPMFRKVPVRTRKATTKSTLYDHIGYGTKI